MMKIINEFMSNIMMPIIKLGGKVTQISFSNLLA